MSEQVVKVIKSWVVAFSTSESTLFVSSISTIGFLGSGVDRGKWTYKKENMKENE